MNEESNVRYVSVSGPTGWAGIAQTIRDVDEDKIKDYKEDIDTLLVFSGLFSAVLTAFVVESYQSLSPDPMTPVVALLGRIAAQTQSYTITAGTINSTYSPTSDIDHAFEPLLWAVRVNQLWFASLTITLITASFAMLVKQWLREYLSMEYTSPHERLRARQFRHPGLATWKVFEIAGLLPIFIQVALGLFLLGMCFFTYSVNVSVGKSSVVLVSGWVFLFTSATLAPIVSPRCPYKTALLKGIMVQARRGIRKLFSSLSLAVVRRDLLSVPEGLANTVRLAAVGLPRAIGSSHPRSLFGQYSLEEKDALKQNVDELEILKEVDAFFLDDDLLATTIFESLTQYHEDPSVIIKFVLMAVNLRLKGPELTQPLTSRPDLRRLTKRGWVAVSDVVGNTVVHAFSQQQQMSSVESWFEDALRLLLSHSDQPLTPIATKALVRCVRKSTISHWVHVLRSFNPSSSGLAPILHILAPLESHMTELIRSYELPAPSAISLVTKFYELEGNVSPLTSPLPPVIDLRALSESMWTFGSHVLGEAILRALEKELDPSAMGTWLDDAISMLLAASPHSLHTAGTMALAALCEETAPYHRFAPYLQGAASPTNPQYPYVFTTPSQRVQLDTVGQQHALAYPNAPPALLFHDHIQGQEDWARYYVLLLMDRVAELPTVFTTWPAGATNSLYTLLSCPVPYNQLPAGTSDILWRILSTEASTGGSLQGLVSISEKQHGYIHMDAAIENVVALVTEADSEGRRRFLELKSAHCQRYTADPPSVYDHDIELNSVRLCALITRIYGNVKSDTTLHEAFRKFYVDCAMAMERFREKKYPSVTKTEQAATVHLAEEGLSLLDSLEPVAEGTDLDKWVSSFQPDDSVFPDAIFEQLALASGDRR
ncbi:hypothetical protein NM688_g4679 [Phlebia brevispora]|uniref:Uncharacterized protein n=1 Tax=Phlebia brevispora TaxID=194682 RepID=A0ACC1T2A5_9APHY|nr:hypothetical protein NM688_g4679 [Phlebia brevispora]